GGFAAGASVKLAKTGQTDISATGVSVISSSQIACSFELTGKATGYWNVIVSTGGAGSLSATITNGFFVNYLGASSITPDHGYNSASVSVTDLRGGGFAAGASVKLAKTGQTDISATGVSVISSSQIACSFELTGKATGYWDVVISTGGAGSLSTVLEQVFAVLCPVAETAEINRVTDGSVILKLESGDVGIEIPAGAFNENVSLTISTAQVPSAGRGTTVVSRLGVEILNDKGLQPVKNSVITMYYRHSDIVGLDETKLIMGRYDPANLRWIPLPSTAYPDQNKVMGATDHFSVFSLIQLKPASSLSSIKVFPNPFDPGRHTQGLTIDNLTSDAEISIFTVSGELVKKVEYTTQNGRAIWDGTNEGGRKVASGVYIALIKASGGNKKVKIAVEK
ncbi:MAG: T9SS type A sorting domain-containing protein, partial [Elusimicrobiota bacterium]